MEHISNDLSSVMRVKTLEIPCFSRLGQKFYLLKIYFK